MSVGIIAEYNPFHNGHIYQINYIKKFFPNKKIVVVMSGDYVQRGELAIASFEARKKMAIKYGVDEVIELPFEFVNQAAHIFAQEAIKILSDNNVTKIVFGSETNNIELFYNVANILKENKEEHSVLLRKYLKTGLSFPKANELALTDICGEKFIMPNDILGIEYVKAIVNNNYNIQAISIKREVAFHSDEVKNNLASASHIRKMIFNNEDISKYSPMVFTETPKKIEDRYSEFQKIIKTTPIEDLAKIKLVSEGMENLFFKNINEPNYNSFVNKVNSKRYTSSRVKRVMLNILLSIY